MQHKSRSGQSADASTAPHNGQFVKGVPFIIGGVVCIALMLALIGFILYPILLLVNIWDAYPSAEKINRRQK